MGKFGKRGDGYILTKFIPETEAKTRIINGMDENSGSNFVFTKLLRKVETKDNAKGNKLGEKIVDFGGITENDSNKLDPETYILTKMIAKCLDMNNSKELENIISKHQHKKEFENAVGYIQELINTNCTRKNYRILENKQELLQKLGLDYVPDIRYVLSGNKRFANDIASNSGLDVMYGISYKILLNLWERYNKILQTVQIH